MSFWMEAVSTQSHSVFTAVHLLDQKVDRQPKSNHRNRLKVRPREGQHMYIHTYTHIRMNTQWDLGERSPIEKTQLHTLFLPASVIEDGCPLKGKEEGKVEMGVFYLWTGVTGSRRRGRNNMLVEGQSDRLASFITELQNNLTSTFTCSALSKLLPEVEKLVVLLWHTPINSSTS